MSSYSYQAHGMAQAANMFNTNNPDNSQNDSDGWFVSYADILLLLLTFFVLLFAFSRVDGAGNNEQVIDDIEKAMATSMVQNASADVLMADVSTKDPVLNQSQKPVPEAEPEVPHVTAVIGEGSVSIVHELIAEADDVASSDGILIDALFDETVEERAQAPEVTAIEPLAVAIIAPDETEAVIDEQLTDINEQMADPAPERSMYETAPANESVEATQQDKPNLLDEAHLVALTVDEQLAKLSAGLTSSEVEVSTGYQSINIELNNKILFPLGEAQLLEEGQVFLNEIAAIMESSDYFASVEGHTDNTPIATPKFPSNWELSSSRATSVARYLISQGVAANRLRAIGYADTKPKVDNSSAESRARNRRVSITFHYDSDAPIS